MRLQDSQPRYLVLMGDIVGSRELPDREGAQQTLKAALKDVNAELGDQLVARLAFAAGDEIQGLFRPGPAPMMAVRRLASALHPVVMTFGLGLGGLSTSVSEAQTVTEVDGEAFHRARAALGEARDRESWGALKGWGPLVDEMGSTLFELLGTIRGQWTHKQALTVEAARDRLQKEVAEEFDVSASVISARLKASFFDSYRRGEAALARLLAETEGIPR